ncbi:Homoserine dehydrogenase, catalytic [Dillenia turbinata]|uniref:Homoserine dehydrogenase, catalytic n=1 Tax=Dillenia turbinata TaxID=194707 RepID=A0AAN8VJL0_9MAGN
MGRGISMVLMRCVGVSRQLLQHIVSCRSLHAKQGVRLRVVGICDSRSLLFVSDVLTKELDDPLLLEVCRIKANWLFTPHSLCHERSLTETIESLVLEDYDKLVSHLCCLRHKSIVSEPCSLRSTLGYVMSEVEDEKLFIDFSYSHIKVSCLILLPLFLFFYTMRASVNRNLFDSLLMITDPRDDLSGMDVAPKALILVRLLGWWMELNSIKIESLCPEEMVPNVMSAEEFLVEGLTLLDKVIEEGVRKASSNGNVLCYVCAIEDTRNFPVELPLAKSSSRLLSVKCSVGIQEIHIDSPLGRLRGSDNVESVFFNSFLGCLKCSSLTFKAPTAMVIQGTGAGNDTTAAAVLADILDIQDLFSS